MQNNLSTCQTNSIIHSGFPETLNTQTYTLDVKPKPKSTLGKDSDDQDKIPNTKQRVELADIFRAHSHEFGKLPIEHYKIITDIVNCRTSVLGGHKYQCDNCGYEDISYNSCRNRHCPKCQTITKLQWIEARKEDLLHIPYFHMVFTISNLFNPIALRNKKIVYDLIFSAASESLKEIAQKRLGIKIGIVAILHTWGQNLMDHPHIHCLVPGGGLSLDESKFLKSKEYYFLPVKWISKVFKEKFIQGLEKAVKKGKLDFMGEIEYLKDKGELDTLIAKAKSLDWMVYSKKPFAGPEEVLEYIGRYTHRVAISNNRILKLENGMVDFQWKDYKDNSKVKVMRLTAHEFIRRFLLHSLPSEFRRIRYFGFLSSAHCKKKIALCKKLLGEKTKDKESCPEKESWQELLLRITGIDVNLCPKCKIGHMVLVETYESQLPERRSRRKVKKKFG